MSFIHETSSIYESNLGDVKIFKNANINNSKIESGCSIGDDTTIERSHLCSNVIINRRSYVNDSVINSFSYAGLNLIMNWARVGRFCSIGPNVYIGGFDHDYHKLTTMPEFRFSQIIVGGGRIPKPMISEDYCEIGNDVWIAAGAQILHKAKIGDGAVIGAGAVVTKEIPPYAIAVGIPAKIVGYRCNESMIKQMLEIAWWNWPLDILSKNATFLMQSDISEKTIAKLQEISPK